MSQDKDIYQILENLDAAQKSVKQLPALFRPANTSPQLSGPYPGKNATLGYLVGEDREPISWSDLDSGLTVEDRMDIFEGYYSDDGLIESLDPQRREMFQGLWSMGDRAQENQSYIVVPLTLIADRVRLLDQPSYLQYVATNSNGNQVFRDRDREVKYPSKVIRDNALYNTFTFADASSYDRFRNMLALSFDIELPPMKINESRDSNPMAQAVIRRIANAHPEWLMKYGPDAVMQAVADVTDSDTDWEEIGSSDVSAYVNYVRDALRDRGGSREEMDDRKPFAEQGVAEGKSPATEDILSAVKAKLGDYIQDVATAIKKDPDLLSKLPTASDRISSVKTIRTDDGHEIKITGNEDDGFRISIKNKNSTSKFNNLDEAIMAVEMYCARRKQAAESADYIEENR